MPAIWNERRYYAARDAARRAWAARDHQLQLGLDEDAVTGTGGVLVEPAAPSPLQPLVSGGLDVSFPYVYAWAKGPHGMPNQVRARLKGRRCRVLAGPARNRTVLVEFEDGERVTTSMRALRRAQFPLSQHAKGGGATLADETRAAPQEGV